MSLDHQYRVCVGSIRAGTPAEIRETAIDFAVNDVPDVAGRYDIEPGYEVALYNAAACTEHRGSGRMIGYAMVVRVTVPAAQASWLAPDAPGADEARKRARRGPEARP